MADLFADIYVERIESGRIDLNYLLEAGGVFDALVEKFIEALKHQMLASQGQLTRAAEHSIEPGADPVGMGLQSAGELLKLCGMKKPPAILQYKVAQALGQMLANQPGAENAEPLADFGGSDSDLFRQ
ncbi:MAG TPA: hypothetical protein EYN66_12775 [Myxococcales bacterium]|nr:hypothetical protein [Myxococcales bacterium]